MNRFETLLAPPSLSPKDLRIHLRMHPEISKDILGSASQELVNVATRLTDELTTVRFGRDLATGPEPASYRQFCAKAVGSSATPIDYRFFADFWPANTPTDQAAAWVDQLSKPWQIQAWAAQALRVACAAELEDTSNVTAAWRRAVALYSKFFELATVEETCTYSQKSDALEQEACRLVWASFLANQVAGLAERVQGYASNQKTRSFQACLETLADSTVAAANPKAAETAKEQAQDYLTAGIKAATTLEDAESLFYHQLKANPMEHETLDRALLEAMTREARLMENGFGEIEAVEVCAVHVSLQVVSDKNVGSLTRAARHEFYEACAAVARGAANQDSSAAVKAQAARLLALVPADWVIGKGMVGQEDITRDAVVEQLLAETLGPKVKDLLERLMQAPACSEQEEQALDALLKFASENASFVAGPQTSQVLAEVLSSVFANAAATSKAEQGSRGRRLMETIAQFLPWDHQIEMDGEAHTASEWIDLFEGGEGVESLLGLMMAVSTAPAATKTQDEALEKLISYAEVTTLSPAQFEALKRCLLMVFGSCTEHLLRDPKWYWLSRYMLGTISRFLPEETTLNLGGETKTLAEHENMVCGLSAFKRAGEAAVGSDSERIAVEGLIRHLEKGIDFDLGGTSFRKRSIEALRQISRLNSLGGSQKTSQYIDSHLDKLPKRAPATKAPRLSRRSKPSSLKPESAATEPKTPDQPAETRSTKQIVQDHITKIQPLDHHSGELLEALKELLSFAKSRNLPKHPEQSKQLDAFLKDLFTAMAKEFLDQPSDLSYLPLSMLHIAHYFPENTSLKISGLKLTLTQHERYVKCVGIAKLVEKVTTGSEREQQLVVDLIELFDRGFRSKLSISSIRSFNRKISFNVDGKQSLRSLLRTTLEQTAAANKQGGSRKTARIINKALKAYDRWHDPGSSDQLKWESIP